MMAVILAGGKGSRLKPLTSDTPKPLLPLGDSTIVERLVSGLKRCGVTKIVMAVNHLHQQIEDVLGDGSKFGLEIKYSVEPKPLSTVGPLKLIDSLDDNFLVANADILTDMNFGALFDCHREKDSILTIATIKRETVNDYGVIETDERGQVIRFLEKPKQEQIVSSGIYVFSKEILNYIPSDQPFGFDELVLKLLENNTEINTYQYDGYWLDIGKPEDYFKAQQQQA